MDPNLPPDMDPDPAIFIINLQDASQKTFFFSFAAYCYLKVHLHNFSKIKSKKRHKTVGIKVFSYYFCLMIEGSGSGSLPHLCLEDPDMDPGCPNTWIRRIRIRNTGTYLYTE
jgi:hypothetical protein